ncbi:MAG TPA: hypothetical protein VH481_08940, partial [Nitrososphaeraceae archaeon]
FEEFTEKAVTRLTKQSRLKQIYDELGENIKPFLSLYARMQENNFTIEQIVEVVNFVGILPQLQERYYTLDTQTASLDSKRRKFAVSVTMLKNQTNEAMREREYYRYECEIKKKELLAINSEVNAKKKFIQNFDNEEGFTRIKEAAKNETECVMQNNRQLLDVISNIQNTNSGPLSAE